MVDAVMPVAVIGREWQLLWTGPATLSEHVEKTGIKIGSLLYAHPPQPLPADVEALVKELRFLADARQQMGFDRTGSAMEHASDMLERLAAPQVNEGPKVCRCSTAARVERMARMMGGSIVPRGADHD